jgi:methanogenic corrinoid protein MtbC1
LNLSKVKTKLRRKIVKQLKKENLRVKIYVDVYGAEEGSVDILTDAIATLKPKKRKKTQKK